MATLVRHIALRRRPDVRYVEPLGYVTEAEQHRSEAGCSNDPEPGAEIVRCDICHSGSAVDFVVVMQRAEDSSRTSLSLAMSGNTPGRVGGSSTATATMAGVAALVWARNPELSRDQVLQILRKASSLYPDRDSSLGFGTVDAALAVSLTQ
jgi:subtilisin family serine protease